MSANLTPEERQVISAEILAGRKIEAIKLYRAATGLGLKEAKDAVENFDHQWGMSSDGANEIPARSNELTTEQVEDITLALANRNKIEAIKIYRNATGKGLKDSKDFIDALIPQLKQQDPVRFAHADEGLSIGCGTKVLLMAMIGGGMYLARLLV